jgi:Predicted membrane-associated, metal-dependent hydrolase
MKLFPKKVSLAVWSLVLAIFTLVAFHGPFFRRVLQNVEGGWNGAVIFGTALLLLLVLDFLLYYALAWFGRGFGKALIAFTLFGDAVMLYFVKTYDVLVTDEMMGNVLRTQYSEASGFFSFPAFCISSCSACCLASMSSGGRWSMVPSSVSSAGWAAAWRPSSCLFSAT